MIDPADAMEGAADLIEQEGWHTGRSTAGYCMVEAIRANIRSPERVYTFLVDHLGLYDPRSRRSAGEYLIRWNDRQTDPQPVIDVLRAGAKAYRETRSKK